MNDQEFEILTHSVNRDVYRMKNIKEQLKQKVDEIADDLSALSKQLYDSPEVAF